MKNKNCPKLWDLWGEKVESFLNERYHLCQRPTDLFDLTENDLCSSVTIFLYTSNSTGWRDDKEKKKKGLEKAEKRGKCEDGCKEACTVFQKKKKRVVQWTERREIRGLLNEFKE